MEMEEDDSMDEIKAHLELAYGYRAEAARSAPLTPEDEEFEDGERSIHDCFIAAARVQGRGSVELGKTKIGDFTMQFLYSHDDGSGAGLFRTEVAGPDGFHMKLSWIPRLAEAAFVFPAALALCDAVAGQAAARKVLQLDLEKGTPVLELGSGTGIFGLVAVRAGLRVVCTDLGDAVGKMRENFEGAGLDKSQAHACELVWGLGKQQDIANACIHGWPTYVFCADLIHDPGMHVSLLSTLAALFRGGSICSVMTCGRRDPQKEVDFRKCAGAEPFRFRIEERTSEALVDGDSVSLLVIHPPS